MRAVLEEIQRLLDRLGECLVDVRGWEQYESDITAENLLRILRRDIEGVLCLANRDLRLLNPALLNTRSVIETFGNLLWLIDSPEATERGVNCLKLIQCEIKETENYIKKLKKVTLKRVERVVIFAFPLLVQSGLPRVASRVASLLLEDYRKAIQVLVQNFENDIRLLEKCQSQIKQKLNVDHNNKSISDFCQRLEDIGREQFYPHYCRFSQSVHANHSATWIYRRDLVEGNGFGEIIEPRDWHAPLYICCYTLGVAGKKFLETFGKNPEAFPDKEIEIKIENALKSLSES
jgi:hypothetical protein